MKSNSRETRTSYAVAGYEVVPTFPFGSGLCGQLTQGRCSILNPYLAEVVGV
jgi:hypothetical protein